MSLLSGLPKIINDAMGSTIFEAGTLKRKGAAISDGRGGQYHTTGDPEDCKVLVEEYSDFVRAQLGIAANERKLIIVAHNFARPKAEDIVTIEGRDWIIVEVQTDPANATYTCRAK